MTEHFAQITALAAIVLAFAAAFTVVGSWWRALLIAAPLSAGIPWTARSYNGESMAVTALLSSAALLVSLFAARRIGRRKALVAVSVAAAAAFILARRPECWSAPLWYESVHGEPFNLTERDYGAWAYPAVAFALAPLVIRHRRGWWFPATAAWCILVCLMTSAFGVPAYAQHSLPMLTALVLTLGAGALKTADSADAGTAEAQPKAA